MLKSTIILKFCSTGNRRNKTAIFQTAEKIPANLPVPGTTKDETAKKWKTVNRQKNTAKLKTAPPVSAKKDGTDEYPDKIHQYIGAYQ